MSGLVSIYLSLWQSLTNSLEYVKYSHTLTSLTTLLYPGICQLFTYSPYISPMYPSASPACWRSVLSFPHSECVAWLRFPKQDLILFRLLINKWTEFTSSKIYRAENKCNPKGRRSGSCSSDWSAKGEGKHQLVIYRAANVVHYDHYSGPLCTTYSD